MISHLLAYLRKKLPSSGDLRQIITLPNSLHWLKWTGMIWCPDKWISKTDSTMLRGTSQKEIATFPRESFITILGKTRMWITSTGLRDFTPLLKWRRPTITLSSRFSNDFNFLIKKINIDGINLTNKWVASHSTLTEYFKSQWNSQH